MKIENPIHQHLFFFGIFHMKIFNFYSFNDEVDELDDFDDDDDDDGMIGARNIQSI